MRFSAAVVVALAPDSLIIIPPQTSFVNTFFQFLYFLFCLYTIYSYSDNNIRTDYKEKASSLFISLSPLSGSATFIFLITKNYTVQHSPI